MKLLLKRDDTSESYPHPDQIDVGELVINSVTGKLYTKLTDGSIVEWISQKVCFDPVPEVSFVYGGRPIVDILSDFCCAGDMFFVEITRLKQAPQNYTFEFVELTTNTSIENITISPAQYTNYSIIENNESINLRKATVPISLSINNTNNISIFKFTLLSDSRKLIEKLITIKCYEQSCSSSSI
jgi:hypothetical protein